MKPLFGLDPVNFKIFLGLVTFTFAAMVGAIAGAVIGIQSSDETVVRLPTETLWLDRPSVTRTVREYELVRGVSTTIPPPETDEEAELTYTVWPDLPEGLSLNTSTGAISGAILEDLKPTTYVVRPTTGTADSFTLSSTPDTANLPTINYTVSDHTLGIMSITPIVPVANTNSPITFTIEPPLPSGLDLHPETGTISGAPIAHYDKTAHKVTPHNLSGSGESVIVKISVIAAPVISYDNVQSYYGRTNAVNPISPNANTVVTSYSVSPPLPNGITINPTTGLFSGTPTVAAPIQVYAVTASNSSGSSAPFNLTFGVIDAPNISFNSTNQVFYATRAGTEMKVASTTETVERYELVPGLPPGLVFNETTGTISTISNAHSPSRTYQVRGWNHAGGGTQLALTIESLHPVPQFDYGANFFTYRQGAPISGISPTLVTSSTGVTWSISPALSAGLTFSLTSGSIGGTPTAGAERRDYTVTATYTAFSGAYTLTATQTISLFVAFDPPTISYPAIPDYMEKGVGISSITPSVDSGAVSSWTVEPSLPSGLTFDTSTGVISGTPSVDSPYTRYAFRGHNVSGGSNTVYAYIEV